MKIRHVGLLLFIPLLLNLIFLNSAFANKKVCIEAFNYAHCAYISGLNDNEARYIKYNASQLHHSKTKCMNSADYYALSQNLAPRYMGNNIINYYICSDELGTQCELLGSDNFTIYKSWFSYSSEPLNYAIDLSAVKDKYPACKTDTKTVS